MEETKKSFKMPIILLVVVLLILLVGAYLYVTNSNKPKNIFIGTIDSLLESSETKQEDIKTMSLNMGLGLNINSQNPEITKVAKYINKAKFTANIQMDLENEKEFIKLGLNYDNEDVLDAKISYKNQEDYIYAKVEELFAKPFSLQVDNEMKSQFKTIYDELKMAINEEGVNQEKAVEIFKNALFEKLKDEYFSQETVEVDISGEKVSSKKSTLTLTDIQLQEVLTGIVTELKENEEFINCFKEADREEIKNALKDIEESFSEINSEITETTITFNIYTKGMNKEFVKFEMIAKDQLAEYVISVLKTDAENYEFLLTEKYKEDNQLKETLKGVITIKNTSDTTDDITLKLSIEEIGEVSVNLQVSCSINEPIEQFDTTNSVDLDNITEADQQKIMTNLQNMKIYSIIQGIVAEFSSDVDSSYNY